MKRTIALILSVFLLLNLAACGGKGADVAGTYTAVSMSRGSEDCTEYMDQTYIRLEKGGKGVYFSGYEFKLKWKLDGETFTGTVSFLGLEEACNGTLKEGILTVTYGDYTYVMVKEGVAPPETNQGGEASQPEPDTDPEPDETVDPAASGTADPVSDGTETSDPDAASAAEPDDTAVSEPGNVDEVLYVIDHYTVSGQTVGPEIIKGAGMDGYYVLMRSDGTGEICPLTEAMPMTWTDAVIKADGGMAMEYSIEEDALTVDLAGVLIVYLKQSSSGSAGSQPAGNDASQTSDGEGEAQTSEGGEASVSAELQPGEPSSAGDGMLPDLDALYRLYAWIKNMPYEYKKNYASYENVVKYIGVEGLDDGNSGPGEVHEFGLHNFFWKYDETNYIYTNFTPNDKGVWVLTNWNTSGSFSGSVPDDIKPNYELPVPEGVDPDSTIECTYSQEVSMTDITSTVTLTIPAYNWQPEESFFDLKLYNAAAAGEGGFRVPQFVINFQSTLDRINFYYDDFTNVNEIESRTVNGVELAGRTYEYRDRELTEFFGELPNGTWVSILIYGIDLSSGSAGDKILNSARFS